MSFSQFISRFAKWWQQESADLPMEMTGNAQALHRDALERQQLKKAQLVFRQWQHWKEQEELARERQDAFKQELALLRQDDVCQVDLPSGEQLAMHLSEGKRWQRFWEDVEEAVGSSVTRPKALPTPIVASSLELREAQQRFEAAVQHQLYDAKQLRQESDELLHLLSS